MRKATVLSLLAFFAIVFSTTSASAHCASAPVQMISASWCGYCRAAIRFFRANGVPYQEYDIDNPRTPANYRAAGKQRGVPIILVPGNEIQMGFSEARLRRQLCL